MSDFAMITPVGRVTIEPVVPAEHVEVGLVAEAGVDFEIVIDVVAVAVGGKNGIQKQS